MINESSELRMRETNPFSLLKVEIFEKIKVEFNHSNPFGVSIKMITLNNVNCINQSNIVSWLEQSKIRKNYIICTLLSVWYCTAKKKFRDFSHRL